MEKVLYLENQDFKNGVIKSYVGRGNPVIIMAQGSYCGYCKMAIPDFQKLANSVSGVVCASIQIDGEESEKQASKLIGKWDPEYKGVPFYLGFNSNGQYVKTHTGGRDTSSLVAFANSLN